MYFKCRMCSVYWISAPRGFTVQHLWEYYVCTHPRQHMNGSLSNVPLLFYWNWCFQPGKAVENLRFLFLLLLILVLVISPCVRVCPKLVVRVKLNGEKRALVSSNNIPFSWINSTVYLNTMYIVQFVTLLRYRASYSAIVLQAVFTPTTGPAGMLACLSHGTLIFKSPFRVLV